MKLSISNIAWSADQDDKVYEYLQSMGIQGLEIAPTRIFSEKPYDKLIEAEKFATMLKEKYGLAISSMQSIWYGQTENMFESAEMRNHLTEYTKKAILFAEKTGCRNLVFGCPRNRRMPDNLTAGEMQKNYGIAVDFFSELAEFAAMHQTVLAMEANPPIYQTNFINTTQQAIQIVKDVNLKGFLVNLDLGTMIHNEENCQSIALEKNISLINHVHISEPGLVPIKERLLHKELITILRESEYDRFTSVEMGKCDNQETINNCLNYVLKL